MAPNFSLPTRPSIRLPATPVPIRTGRCFRTNADGSIALGSNWRRILWEARGLGPLALQTGHAHGRLISYLAVPAFMDRPDGSGVDSEDGSLSLFFAGWNRAWGTLRPCECCGSPGRVEFCNMTGCEFLQMCATPNSHPAAWADFLAEVASPALEDRPKPTSLGALPAVPAAAIRAAGGTPLLISLMMALGDQEIAITGSLRTPNVWHSLQFVPHGIAVEDGILTSEGECMRMQIDLCAVIGLALQRWRGGWILHVVGPGDTILFTLSAPSDSYGFAMWHFALHSAFPFVH